MNFSEHAPNDSRRSSRKKPSWFQKRQVLVHFNPKKEIVLSCDACDWCSFGTSIGRKIKKTNRFCLADSVKYMYGKEVFPSWEEGLACFFGVKKFHAYLYGRSFTLMTASATHCFQFSVRNFSSGFSTHPKVGFNYGNVRVYNSLEVHSRSWKCRCNESTFTSRITINK